MRLIIMGVLIILALSYSKTAAGGMDADPLLFSIDAHRFEWQEEDAFFIESEFWIGRDLSRWVLDLELEHHAGKTEELIVGMTHRRAISAFWNVDVGFSHILEEHEDTFLRLSVNGLAPYFIESDIALEISDSQTSLTMEFEHELWLSSDWLLASNLELDLMARANPHHQQAKGLNKVKASLMLKYERHKHVHPYFGIERKSHHGQAAQYVQSKRSTQLLAGISFWF